MNHPSNTGRSADNPRKSSVRTYVILVIALGGIAGWWHMRHLRANSGKPSPQAPYAREDNSYAYRGKINAPSDIALTKALLLPSASARQFEEAAESGSMKTVGHNLASFDYLVGEEASLGSDDPRSSAALGIALVNMGEHSEAIHYLCDAVTSDPSLTTARLHLAIAYKNCEMDGAAARESEWILRNEPASPEALYIEELFGP